MNTTHQVSTAKDKDSDEKQTLLTIDWGTTPATVVSGPVGKLAAQQFIVHLQQGWRKHGILGKVTAKIEEYKSGGRAALTTDQMLEVLVEGAASDPKKKADLEAKLKAAGFMK